MYVNLAKRVGVDHAARTKERSAAHLDVQKCVVVATTLCSRNEVKQAKGGRRNHTPQGSDLIVSGDLKLNFHRLILSCVMFSIEYS